MVWGRQASSLVGASGLLRTALLRQADWVLLAADQVAPRMLPAHLADMEVHMLLPKDPESERLVQWVEGGERSLRWGLRAPASRAAGLHPPTSAGSPDTGTGWLAVETGVNMAVFDQHPIDQSSYCSPCSAAHHPLPTSMAHYLRLAPL